MSVAGSMAGDHLRLCLPDPLYPPWFTRYEPPHVEGLAAKTFVWLSTHLGFSFDWILSDVRPLYSGQMSSIALTQHAVSEGVCDVAMTVLDVAADYKGDDNVAHTQPFAFEPMSVLVRKEFRGNTGWEMFEPFTAELWVAVLGTWLVIAVCIVITRATQPREAGQQAPVTWRLAVRSIYSSATTLIGEGVDEWKGWPGKLLHVSVLVFGLIILACYTASLTAFFTQPKRLLVGPLTQSAFRTQPTCASTTATLELFKGSAAVGSFTPPYEVQALGPMAAIGWCASQVQDGRASSLIGTESDLQAFLLNGGGCSGFAYAPALRGLLSSSVHLVVGGNTGYPAMTIAANLTRGIAELQRSEEYGENFERFLLRGRGCPDEESEEVSGATQLDVRHLSGLFILTATTLSIAVLGSLVERAITAGEISGIVTGQGFQLRRRRRARVRGGEAQPEVVEAVMAMQTARPEVEEAVTMVEPLGDGDIAKPVGEAGVAT
jgi:hypothetical protein